jgi:hypothetical protein
LLITLLLFNEIRDLVLILLLIIFNLRISVYLDLILSRDILHSLILLHRLFFFLESIFRFDFVINLHDLNIFEACDRSHLLLVTFLAANLLFLFFNWHE